jgi:hypothetical protein
MLANTGTYEVVAGVKNETVLQKTGRDWDEWFSLLDQLQADTKPHKEIAQHLFQNYQLSGWWSQMVTVGYEQARGLRQKHQKGKFFEVSRSKSINAPIEMVWRAWVNESMRDDWLPGFRFFIRKATPIKSMRITWADNRTGLNVYFYPKGMGKCQISVQHVKLTSSNEAEAMKLFWETALEDLKYYLEM